MRLDIGGRRFALIPVLRQHVARGLRFALGRFGGNVRRVTVRVADVNGPRRGIAAERAGRAAERILPGFAPRERHPEEDPTMTRWNDHLETIVLLGASSALVGGTGRALLPKEEAPALHRVVRELGARA